MYRRRRLVAALTTLVVLTLVVVGVRGLIGSTVARSRTTTSVPAIEAGVEPWQLPSAVSREAVVPSTGGFTVVGGLNAAGQSVSTISSYTPSGVGGASSVQLPVAVHDASAVRLGNEIFLYGGGSPTTIASVQAMGTNSATGVARSTIAAPLPTPRSDSAAVTIATPHVATAYVVGGYTGSNYLPDVLATTSGDAFKTVARLAVPVRYPAVAASGGVLYVLGGEVAGGAGATADVQAVDPSTGSARWSLDSRYRSMAQPHSPFGESSTSREGSLRLG